MVNYGKQLVQAQRAGWESAYLDYKRLKKIIGTMEERRQTLVQGVVLDSGYPQQPYNASTNIVASRDLTALKLHFFNELRLEIEKVSLFVMKKQGELSDAIGAMRFVTNTSFDQESPILRRSLESTHFDKLEKYAILGVEMLHIFRFISINAIGIQKILKKYNKVFESMDEPHFYYVGSEHLQQLATNQTMSAIQSSLQFALAESYQENAATIEQDAEYSLAFLRFHSIMECSVILRRNAAMLQAPFFDFLSKQSMIMTGTNFGGMDGGGVRALQWLLKLQPKAFLSMDRHRLERNLQRCTRIPQNRQPQIQQHQHQSYQHDENRLTPMPKRLLSTIQEEEFDELSQGRSVRIKKSKWLWGGVNAISMILNLNSILLYTINYYIIAPTANHYAINLGTDGAFGATLIGASSLSAIFAAFCYSFWYIRSTFRSALIFSTICPLIGNLFYAIAISYRSLPMAIGGRILCGFGSAEVLNRQLISACVDFDGMTRASALFVAFGASGMSIGPLIAGVLDVTAGRDVEVDLPLPYLPAGGVIYDNVTAPGFVMAGMWLLQLFALCVWFEEPTRVNGQNNDDTFSASGESTDSEGEIEIEPSTGEDTYGSMNSSGEIVLLIDDKSELKQKSIWADLKSTWSLVFQNPGLPVSLFIFCFIELADEVIISSCSMVVRRYFDWHGSIAGFLIAGLGALVLPAHFAVEQASLHLSERKILFRSLVVIMICLFGIINYSGMLVDAVAPFEVDSAADKGAIKSTLINGEAIAEMLTPDKEIYYNWKLGKFTYVFFLSSLFMATIVLEGVDTSIMSKVTPSSLNDRFFNCGLLATLIGTLGRVLSDLMITVSALLDVHIFIDFVNTTFFPLILLTALSLYLVGRYYKSLV